MVMQLIRIAFTNLLHRRLRSWLTILGILIGILAIVSLLSLSQGLREAVMGEFARVGADKVYVMPASLGPGFSSSSTIGDSDVDVIERVTGVDQVTYAIMRVGKMSFNDKVRYPYVSGLELDQGVQILDEFGFLEAQEGRVIRDGSDDDIVIGHNFRFLNVFGKPIHVGNTIDVEGTEFKVVGVLERMGDPGVDGGVMMTRRAAEKLFDIDNEYDIIYVKVNTGEDVAVVAERIKRALRNHRDVEERKEDFTVQTTEDVADQLFTILNIISGVLIGIAAISLLVGAVGIMNTMYTAILERTNEIGVMKAIGATNRDIMTLFMIEAGFLGFAGGVIGVLLGMGISSAVAAVARAALGTNLFQASFSPLLIGGALLFAFLMGVFSGFLPSWQASKMRPVESLRY